MAERMRAEVKEIYNNGQKLEQTITKKKVAMVCLTGKVLCFLQQRMEGKI